MHTHLARGEPIRTNGISGDAPTGALLRRAKRFALGCLTAGLLIVPTACTTVLVRSAVPEAELDKAQPYGIEAGILRLWGDSLSDDAVAEILRSRRETLQRLYSQAIARGETIPMASLALSGGGPDGAFGAGLLAGWTARGDRPEFQLVTGVSTGAIIALFAFLGPDYDEALREIYTTYETDDLLVPTLFAGLTGGTALMDTRKYRALIERYVDDEVVEKIAEGYRQGRVLLIGTTNIDASRPVIWNVGAIAASGHPDAKRLVHDVVQASSAIPGAFPPVIIPVETADGSRHDEMHVDGGATQQVILYSPSLRAPDIDEGARLRIDRDVYIVMNNAINKPYHPVRPRLASIAGKAASSLIGGSGSGDIYRIFAIAQRDGFDMNVIAIPPTFDAEPEEMFDPVYMGALYQLGYDKGLEGDDWSPYPLDYAPPG